MPVINDSSNFTISNAILTEVHGNAAIIQFNNGKFTDIEKDLVRDYMANLIALPDISDMLKKHSVSQSISNLLRAQAAYNDYDVQRRNEPCFKGTREAILQEIAEWVIGPDESRIYVLSGLAGIGKSTIAYTVSARADNLGLLGASFFFSRRNEDDRKNAKRFFTTLAFQLCVLDQMFSQAIGTALVTERGSAATTKGIQEQLQMLILEPLRDVIESRVRPVVIVVDALDECDEEDGPSVLTALSRLVQDLPTFKVILTTRPQPLLNYQFVNRDGHKIFHLQDIEDKVVDSDIRLYLKHYLSREQVQAHLGDPEEEWYASDEEIEALVQAAGRLFIIASTAVRFILDKYASDPAARMDKLLRSLSQDHTPFKDLNHFYSIVLRNAVPEDCDDTDILDRYQLVVGTIVLIQIPLPLQALARLIDGQVKDIRAVVRNLQSVILLGSDNTPLVYHKSFPDYVTDPTRCKDVDLKIDTRAHNTRLVLRCLRIMNGNLKYNILRLGDPARFMDNKDALVKQGISEDQQMERIPLDLRYACAYWANHLEGADVGNASLVNALEKFANEHLLHWFETLSWIRKLDSAHRALRVALRILNSTTSDLRQLLSDALQFISKFYELIEQASLHTYYSALPLMPTGSLLYDRYKKETVHNLCSIQGGPKMWDTVLANPTHGEPADNVSFSLDSSIFASWNEQNSEYEGTLKIWDALAGTPIGTIVGNHFAIANDLSTVASAKDGAITLYRVKGVAPVSTFTTSSATVLCLAYSSEVNRIAAGLSDGTVCLWDGKKGELIANLDGFAYIADGEDGGTDGDGTEGVEDGEVDDEGSLRLLAYSPTGTRLAYASIGGGIRLRGGIDGEFIADLDTPPEERYCEFVFPRGGSRIAALTNSRNVTLWSCEKGGRVGLARDAGHTVAISSDGFLLATALENKVKLWRWDDENSQPLIEDPSLGSLEWVDCLVFSPTDDILAIAATGYSDTVTLYNLESHSVISILRLPPCHPKALAFSPDCTRLASGNESGTVHLWDVQNIKASGCPPKERPSSVTALALSQDCSRLACGFEDGVVELWETGHTHTQISHHQSHNFRVSSLEFSFDGKQFASASGGGIVKLWDSTDGALLEILQHPSSSSQVAEITLSSHTLAAAVDNEVVLWDLSTLGLIYTLTECTSLLSFSNHGVLLASFNQSVSNRKQIKVLDVEKHTTAATFDLDADKWIDNMEFLHDDSQLVVQFDDGDFLSFNISNGEVLQGPKLELLGQLRHIPHWNGIPVWLSWDSAPTDGIQVVGLFSGQEDPVPVLRIPHDVGTMKGKQGSSMIVLGCKDGRVIILRSPNSY